MIASHPLARVTLAFGLLLCLLMAVGCQSQSQAEVARQVESSIPLRSPDAYKLGYAQQWLQDLSAPENATVEVYLLEDMLVTVEHPSHLVTGISPRDGTVLWRVIVGRPTDRLTQPFRIRDKLTDPVTRVVRERDYVVICSERQIFHINPRSGVVELFAPLDSLVAAGPGIQRNREAYADEVPDAENAFFGTVDGRIYAHSLRSNQLRWAYQMTDKVSVRPQYMPGAGTFVAGLLVADNNGIYAMLSPDNGVLQWKRRAWAPIVTDPVFTAQGIFIASRDQQLYAVQRATGQDLWIYRAPAPLTQSPIVIDTTVYQPVPELGLVAIDHKALGKVLWTQPGEFRPVLHRDRQVMLHSPASISMLDLATGKPLLDVPVTQLQRVIVGPGNTLYLVGARGLIQRLDPRS